MIIRSQDKNHIIPLEKVESIDREKGNVLASFSEESHIIIGKYTTEQQALQVLDEIQNACYSTMVYRNGELEVNLPAEVYQMPPDEVEVST